jgi:putative thioredoxin
MGYDITDFETQVVQRSQTIPVLADFWAPWCGPCRTLGPVLERLAESAGTRWELAKINVEDHKDVAEDQQISGIPAVKLFHVGQVVGEFTGVKSERDLRKFLEQHLPSPKAKEVAEARAWMEANRFAEAAVKLEGILALEPTNDAARLALAECQMTLDPSKVGATLAPISVESSLAEKAGALRTLCRFAGLTDNIGTLAEAPVKARYIEAATALRRGNHAAALEGFIDVLTRRRDYDHGGAKTACQAIFMLLGIRHPLAEKFHRAFSSALHS